MGCVMDKVGGGTDYPQVLFWFFGWGGVGLVSLHQLSVRGSSFIGTINS